MTASLTKKIKAALRRDGSDEQLRSFSEFVKAPFAPGGGAARRSRMTLPALFLCGLIAGLSLCGAAKGILLSVRLDADISAAGRISGRAPSFANAGSGGGVGGFTKANPFGADLPEKKEDKPAVKTAAISSFTLHGTLPNVGAWINSGSGGMTLVLKGQDIGGYTLDEIKYGEAVLTHGGDRHSLYLIFSGGATASLPPPPPPRQPRAPAKPQLDFSGVEPASEGQEGAVPRELVDALLMNPYDELGKMRMVPAEDGSGMKLERLAPDSIFARVGVAQGDIISAVNGVSISNVADAANAMNSLMAGTRFDVTVTRGGKPLELKYQVK